MFYAAKVNNERRQRIFEAIWRDSWLAIGYSDDAQDLWPHNAHHDFILTCHTKPVATVRITRLIKPYGLPLFHQGKVDEHWLREFFVSGAIEIDKFTIVPDERGDMRVFSALMELIHRFLREHGHRWVLAEMKVTTVDFFKKRAGIIFFPIGPYHRVDSFLEVPCAYYYQRKVNEKQFISPQREDKLCLYYQEQ
ncbi:hypothetical protein M1O16_03425 [Dehalococcoidia bacterium]|nr:hypothetical protein [Dehalococcoidia bacterium]